MIGRRERVLAGSQALAEPGATVLPYRRDSDRDIDRDNDDREIERDNNEKDGDIER